MKTIAVLLAALTLAGCAGGPDPIALDQHDRQYCMAQVGANSFDGSKPLPEAYVNCRRQLDFNRTMEASQRQARAQAVWQNWNAMRPAPQASPRMCQVVGGLVTCF